MSQIVQQVKTMSSIEIADLAKKHHNHVMRDIRAMLVELKIDSSIFGQVYTAGNGQQQPCFYLPHDETICLMTGYDVKARMVVIKRWQELELAPAFTIPSTLSGALRLAAEQADTIEQQAAQLLAAAPAVAFVSAYVDTTGTKGFREVCKLIGANEHKFRAFLDSEKILYLLGGNWIPYSHHLDAARFVVRQGTSNDHAFTSVRFTAKGVSWIAGEWAKRQVAAQIEVYA